MGFWEYKVFGGNRDKLSWCPLGTFFLEGTLCAQHRDPPKT